MENSAWCESEGSIGASYRLTGLLDGLCGSEASIYAFAAFFRKGSLLVLFPGGRWRVQGRKERGFLVWGFVRMGWDVWSRELI